jgi:hypothetical protein
VRTEQPRWWLPAIAVLALAAASFGLANGFAYDDVFVIVENPLVRHLASWPDVWSSAYWPSGLLYRPLTIQLFAIEWALGGGQPGVFHLVNAGLAIATAIVLWRLAQTLLPPPAAFVAVAVFAVHPVHVEAVANVVGQAELLATLFAVLALERFLAWRRAGPLSASRRWALALLTLLAILSKETGYAIPLLLAAAELTVIRAEQGPGWRVRSAVVAVLPQLGALLAAAAMRLAVLGPTTGGAPATGLRDLGTAERLVGMLAVVPHWFRLLLWPAHLQAEYGPPALAVTGSIGTLHVLGLALVLATVALAGWTWRTRPVVTFGIAWTAIALLPVSNLLAPTGVILAERTLYLPSAGAVLALGAGWAALVERGVTIRAARFTLHLATGVALLLGLTRTAARSRVWRDTDSFVAGLLADAPNVSRAHKVAALHWTRTGRSAEAELAWRTALELYDGDPRVYEELGQLYRSTGRCPQALAVLEPGLQRHPDRTPMRSRLIECLLLVGDTVRARALAAEAVREGRAEFEQTLRRLSTPAR